MKAELLHVEGAMALDIFLFGNPIFKNLESHLQRQVTRSELIAGTLANVETPGYKARDLDFSQVLMKQLGGDGMRMSTTHEGHIGASDQDEVVLKTQMDKNSKRADGNTVDMDEEMGKLAALQLMYEAGVQALSKKLAKIAKAASE
jgi:flagellar basal-body rod protein FlgB